MPAYEFKCKTCEKDFEIRCSMSEYKPEQKCPGCQSEDTQRIFRAASVQFVGAGWPGEEIKRGTYS